MNLREQLSYLLPTTGRYCLFTKTQTKNIFFDDLESLACAVESRSDETGVYMALASYGEANQRTQDNAHTLHTLYLDIDCGEAKFKKHPEGAYPTQQEGVLALVEFSKAVNFMPSVIVSSGEGLHVYYVLDGDYPTDQVAPVMKQLRALCKLKGLRDDPACTTDTARVLRPVGSLHSVVDGQERRVSVMKKTKFVHSLDDLSAAIALQLPIQQSAVASMRNLNDDVLDYPQRSASIEKVARNCAAVAKVRDTMGDVPEPHWRAFIGIAKHCDVDGETAVHKWSEGYVGYSFEETQAKLDNWKTPPATCEHMALHHKGCDNCQHKGKITSAIQLGLVDVVLPVPEDMPEQVSDALDPTDEEIALATTAEELRPDLFVVPEREGFFFVKHKRDWQLFHRKLVEVKDPSGEGKTIKQLANVHVANRLFWLSSYTDSRLDDDIGSQLELMVIQRADNQKLVRHHIPANIMADNAAMARKLLEKNIIFTSDANAVQSVNRFLRLEQIRIQHNMKYTIRNRFGYDWHEGEFICAYGDRVLHADGHMEETLCHPNLRQVRKYVSAGFLPDSVTGQWGKEQVLPLALAAGQRYAKFVQKYFPAGQFSPHRRALALGIASPYLVFADAANFIEGRPLPGAGLVVSLFSSASGRGKTALQQLISAAFTQGGGIVGGDTKTGATAITRSGLASGLGVFPLLLDEVSQNEASNQAADIQCLANGSARMRSLKSGRVAEVSDWNAITLMSTNMPQTEIIVSAQLNTEALMCRLVEISFESTDSTASMDALIAEYAEARGPIMQEGGAIGVLLTLAAVQLGRDRMAAEVAMEFKRLHDKYKVPANLRYITRVFAAARFAHKVLRRMGAELVTDAEITDFFEETCTVITARLKTVKRTPEENLGYMLGDISPSIAVTMGYPGRGPQNAEVLLNHNNPSLPLLGRQVLSDNRIYISTRAVAAWCTRNRISREELLKQLRMCGRLVTEGEEEASRRSLSAGISTIPEQGRTQCYCFTANGPALQVVNAPPMPVATGTDG
jgi:hypothetical protein